MLTSRYALALAGLIWAAGPCAASRAILYVTNSGGNDVTLVDVATNSYAGCYGAGGDITAAPADGNGLFVRNGRFNFRDVPDGLGSGPAQRVSVDSAEGVVPVGVLWLF